MFRCPNCGEKIFSKFQKFIGMYKMFDKCPYCKARSRLKTYKNVVLRYYYGTWIFILYCIVLALIGRIFNNYIPNSIMLCLIGLFPALYIFYHYFCCHYDVYKYEKERYLGIMSFSVSNNKYIWPTIRYGEIYVIVPAGLNNPNIEEIKTIAQLIKIEKNENEKILRFRVIRKSQETQLKHNAEVVIINDFDSEKYRMIKGRIL